MTSVLAGLRPWMAGSQKMQEQFSARRGSVSRSDIFVVTEQRYFTRRCKGDKVSVLGHYA